MILVRMVCQAKFGRSGEVVAGFKQSQKILHQEVAPHVSTRLMTGMSGPFDTVVLELEAESLAEWERLRPVIFSHPAVQEAEADMPSLIDSGRTEYYTIEAV